MFLFCCDQFVEHKNILKRITVIKLIEDRLTIKKNHFYRDLILENFNIFFLHSCDLIIKSYNYFWK